MSLGVEPPKELPKGKKPSGEKNKVRVVCGQRKIRNFAFLGKEAHVKDRGAKRRG